MDILGFHPLGSVASICILSKSQLRAIAGVALVTSGAVILGLGLAVIALAGFGPAASAVAPLAGVVPGAGRVVAAAANVKQRTP